MQLVAILVGLVVLALFLYVLNLILDKLLPSMGLDAGWAVIVKLIVTLFVLVLAAGTLGVGPA